MRVRWSWALLLAGTASLPLGGLTAPCKISSTQPQVQDCAEHLHISGSRNSCSRLGAVIRGAEPAIVPIIPVPRPFVPVIVPPIAPKPFIPKPVTPKPAVPLPLPLKPLQPPQNKPNAGAPCKRAPGDACSNVAPFENAGLEIVRIKGRDTQASLLLTQRTSPLPQDINRADVSSRYERQTRDDAGPPISPDEIYFLSQGSLQVQFSTGRNWFATSTRNQDGLNTNIDNNILESSINRDDRVMVISDSRNKENDLLGAQDRLPWSDMAMYDLKKAFEGQPIGPHDLRYMIRTNIDSGSSAANMQVYIDSAISRVGGDRAEVNTFRSDPDMPGISTDELAGYQLLAGSDHVHQVLPMLKDYPTTMRNIRIESLSVTIPITRDATDEYNIVIKFVQVENP